MMLNFEYLRTTFRFDTPKHRGQGVFFDISELRYFTYARPMASDLMVTTALTLFIFSIEFSIPTPSNKLLPPGLLGRLFAYLISTEQ